MPLVSIIVANYNGGQLIESCIRSLLKSKTGHYSYEIIVVDNASTDGSPDLIVKRFPAVRLIRLTRNLGYAAANNIGIRAAAGEYLVLLNSDTRVDPKWLTSLLGAAEHNPHAAFLQPKILFLDNHGMINSAGNDIHCAGFGVCRGIGTRDVGQYDHIRKIGYASGACVMVSRKALADIGILDEIFYAYGEDKDWGWRAMMLGYQSIYVPTAKVYHKWSAVLGWSPKKMYYLELERLISIWKNHSKRMLILLAPTLVIVEVAVLIHALFKGWWKYKIMCYVHAFASRAQVMKRRRELFSARKTPDNLLIREFVFELQHPYVGKLTEPLNFLCQLFRRILIFD